jgi:hypothetical protein
MDLAAHGDGTWRSNEHPFVARRACGPAVRIAQRGTAHRFKWIQADGRRGKMRVRVAHQTRIDGAWTQGPRPTGQRDHLTPTYRKQPMMPSPLARWHRLVADRDAGGIDAVLADAVVFHSPVVHTPQVGKAITRRYLAAALQVFMNDSFRYVREISGPRDAVLEFQVTIDGIDVNGVDMITWDDAGQIVEFKVMLRPLKAVNLIHQKMAAMLAPPR